jgi:hypothetical protein
MIRVPILYADRNTRKLSAARACYIIRNRTDTAAVYNIIRLIKRGLGR